MIGEVQHVKAGYVLVLLICLFRFAITETGRRDNTSNVAMAANRIKCVHYRPSPSLHIGKCCVCL